MPISAFASVKGIINGVDMDYVSVGVLKNLRHQSLGIWNTATPDNLGEFAGGAGGIAVFRTQTFQKFKDYTAANSKDAANNPGLNAVQITEKGKFQNKWEIETLDIDKLGLTTQDQWQAYLIANLATSMAAYMDAEYLKTFVQAALTDTTKQIVLGANWSATDTTNRTNTYFTVSDTIVDLRTSITSQRIGLNDQDLKLSLHGKLKNRLILSAQINGDTATAISQKLLTPGATVEGMGHIVEHPFFDKDILANSVFVEDKRYNFKNVIGVLAHKDANFTAIKKLVTTTYQNNRGNLEFITKASYYSDLVRDDLYKVFVVAQITTTTNPF